MENNSMNELVKVLMAISFASAIIGSVVGCASKKAHSTASTYSIDSKDLAVVTKGALSGDEGSSIELGDYYFYVKNNFEEAEFWYNLAVRQGNEEAVFKLSTTLSLLNKEKLAINVLEALGEGSVYSLEKHKELGKLYYELENNEKSVHHYCVSALLGDRYSSGKVLDIYLNHFGNGISIAYYWANYLLKLTEDSTFAYREVERIIDQLKVPEDRSDVLDAVGKTVFQKSNLEEIQDLCSHWDKQYPYQKKGHDHTPDKNTKP